MTPEGGAHLTDIKTQFSEFLTEEVNRYKGITVPVKANLLQRIFVRKIRSQKLHPNLSDEFCDPKIGPNYSIISRYEENIRNQMQHAQHNYFDEALLVEKMHPDGYMILNGHHRWAAAIRMRVPRIPARIVNLTHAADVQEMLKNARHNKRVTLDLDEVVFMTDGDSAAEKALTFPLNKLYAERLRRGVPALFHFIKKQGYDIWVYTARYYSPEYIQKLFRHYRVRVDGVVTGTERKAQISKAEKRNLEALISKQYPQTIHIDGRSLLCTCSTTKKYEVFPLSGDPFTWSQETMEIMGAMKKHA